MKAKVTINGFEVELEGTSDEIAAVVRAATMPAFTYVPHFVSAPAETSPIFTLHKCRYPQVWYGVNPPPCEECGVAAAPATVFIGQNTCATSREG